MTASLCLLCNVVHAIPARRKQPSIRWENAPARLAGPFAGQTLGASMKALDAIGEVNELAARRREGLNRSDGACDACTDTRWPRHRREAEQRCAAAESICRKGRMVGW